MKGKVGSATGMKTRRGAGVVGPGGVDAKTRRRRREAAEISRTIRKLFDPRPRLTKKPD